MWLHSLKVAQLLRSAACLHTNQTRSYLNHLVFVLSRAPEMQLQERLNMRWEDGIKMCMMEAGYKVTRLMNCVQLQAFISDVLSSFWFLLPHLVSCNSATRVLSVSNFILIVITIYHLGVVNLEYYEHKLIKFITKFMREDQKLCMRKKLLVNLSPTLLYHH